MEKSIGMKLKASLAEVGQSWWWGPGSKFLGTNLDSFQTNWILEMDMPWTVACILVLLIMSSPLSSFSPSHPIDLPSKMMPSRFGLYLPLFGLGPSSKVTLSSFPSVGHQTAPTHWLHVINLPHPGNSFTWSSSTTREWKENKNKVMQRAQEHDKGGGKKKCKIKASIEELSSLQQ